MDMGTEGRISPAFGLAIAFAALLGCVGCEGLAGPKYGKTVWLAELDSGGSVFTSTDISSAPAIGPDGTIYVGATKSSWWPFPMMYGEDGFAVALSPDGRRKWRYNMSSGVSAVAVADDGTVYATAGRELHALKSNGTIRWTFAVDTGTLYAPAVGADGVIYAAVEDSGLYALNQNGTPLWHRQLAEYPLGSPVIRQDARVSVPCHGKVVTLDKDGSTCWEFSTSRWSARIIAVGSSSRLYVADNDSLLYALDQHGNEEWRTRLSGLVSAGVVDENDNCVFGLAEDDTVLCVSPQGAILWKAVIEWPSRSAPPIGTDSAIYATCMNHAHCFGPDGQERWHAKLADYAGTPILRPDGVLLVPDGSQLRALTTASSGLAVTPWPSSRHDIRNTGRSD
jgi:outer membrane protein assembly factor BamB